jgi:hypothetical protein
MHISQINILILNFFMSSTHFEPEGSSAGRRLYIQFRYGTFHMYLYKQSSRRKSVYRTHYTIPVYTTGFLQINPRVRNV